VRFNIGTEDSRFFDENRKPDNAVLNAATERSSLAYFQIPPPKQARVFGTTAKCYSINTDETLPPWLLPFLAVLFRISLCHKAS